MFGKNTLYLMIREDEINEYVSEKKRYFGYGWCSSLPGNKSDTLKMSGDHRDSDELNRSFPFDSSFLFL